MVAESALPEPDSVSLAHSNKLVDLIKQRISGAGGRISFADFMTHALYEPGLGYYMAGATKFGSQGDFVTAPEITPLFGAAVAVQLREVLERVGGGILELGAGSGSLALSILKAMDDIGDLKYTILEPSAELRQRQRQLLATALSPAQLDRVNWISALPEDFIGVIVANEVMDALPVERFSVINSSDRLQQLLVSSEFKTVERASQGALSAAIAAIEADLAEPLAPGYQSEVCLLLKPWISSLAKSMNKGVLLVIDYGYPRREYYLPERTRGTLACYYRHRAHDDAFQWPGLQDITAHVDFTSVAEAAALADLELLGYATQSAFLLDNDLLVLAEALGEQLKSDADRIAVARAIKTLTLPGEMGERFQVMALGKGYDHALRGFATQDLAHRL
ncbi:MAG: class I SAM-dependent methyltransferase [Granulosicoccus sp.]